MKKRTYHYSGQRFGRMSYLVSPGHFSRSERQRTCIGIIDGGRNHYVARAMGSDGSFTWCRRLGPFATRDKAADAIVDYLSGYKYGRELLERIGWMPTRDMKRRWSLPPGWPHVHQAALSRLLHRREPTSYEVLAEAEDWWEVRLDFAFDGALANAGGTSEIWLWRFGAGTQMLSLDAG
jgi:hypothetical protein